jgi:hypothetical protein
MLGWLYPTHSEEGEEEEPPPTPDGSGPRFDPDQTTSGIPIREIYTDKSGYRHPGYRHMVEAAASARASSGRKYSKDGVKKL